jgi:DNA repair protein RecN (Recombination protein N)
MIDKIYIKDYAIVRELDLPFFEGFTVITGETGAGKSLIVKALSMALGSKAEKTDVRSGQERAVVEVSLTNQKNYRRLLSKAGRIKSYVDDEPFLEDSYRELVYSFADFHGQNEQQLIMDSRTHIDFLDRFCKHENKLTDIEKIYNELIFTKEELNRKLELSKQSNDKKELLEFQLNEIQLIRPKVNEDEELTNEFKRLNNTEETINAIQKLNQSLTEHDHSIYRQLYSAIDELEDISKFDKKLSLFLDVLKQSSLSIQESSCGLIEYLDQIENDPSKLREVNDRLQSIESLKRKYGGSIESVIDYVETIQVELDDLSGLDAKIDKLKSSLSALISKYINLAEELSHNRSDMSRHLSQQIETTMETLNMEGATFKVEIQQKPSQDETVKRNDLSVKFGPKGYDHVEFYLSANPGEAIKPLSKIASGGEVSRIMLSIKSVLKEDDPVQTLVFDEIDSGISGEAADKVANALKALSKDKQVICITHLPQIASLADNHLFVGKKVVDKKTYVNALYLDDNQKISAVAKLFSGDDPTSQVIGEKNTRGSRARG